MGLSKDDSRSDPTRLVTSRVPVGPNSSPDNKSVGDEAFKDALIIIGIAWAVLLFLAFSLRSHNV